MTDRHYVCDTDKIDEEDLLRFDYEDQTFCIYHTPEGFFATDGYCTHEEQHLEGGIVIDNVIECPLHQGRFDVRTGKALSAPACIDLKTYPVTIENNKIYISLANKI
ncbi:MAG: Rieske family ferredoxin [Acidiferrobacteraceae bacterium]|jgi:3-phenylpropionate/trans-cinnamate dioxygenase ferredoxin subunit|nr:Rieske family ferredoxin [Acidiferrobacteraceae bacterium]MCP4828735.1 non-heme iron oxygenase ferredoxin subunit [Pseudomonadota bacterium]MDP6138030.1 non-heme iron oxygenase ferredoxin subunit [Arenicellales bacterium]MDP6950217.1 non-heme iron oxygenase ferredoxin subunit [Arenicellales bacterium]HJP07774.1 non-heme iron oxygenase ferredoxin subunit [Arenicellales bacterium]|tara:strand:- start:5250 stop:5570 length:321 start_codon:yes stop_codon:yes gene_type:complete